MLIVFRNPSDSSTVRQALQALAIEVLVAATGRQALALARSRCCDGLILDVRLPDVDGLDLVQALHDDGCRLPWFAYAAAWSPDAARRAHHLGARHLLHTLPAAQMVDGVRSALARPTPIAHGPDAHERAAASAADAWARLVVAGAAAPHDLRTLRMWAHVAGVSRTVLRARCRLAGVAAKPASDLARVVRARLQTLPGEAPALWLDCGDERTRGRLLRGAGVDESQTWPSVGELLERQTFVPPAHEAVRALKRHLVSGAD